MTSYRVLHCLLLLVALPTLSSAVMLSSSEVTISNVMQSQQQSNTYSQDWVLTVTGGSGSGYLDLWGEVDTVSNEGNLHVTVDTFASLSLQADGSARGESLEGPGFGPYTNPQRGGNLTLPFTFGVPEIIHVGAYTMASFAPSLYAGDIAANQSWQGLTIYGKVFLDTTPRHIRPTYLNYDYAADSLIPGAQASFTPLVAVGDQAGFTPLLAAPEPTSFLLMAVGLGLLTVQKRLASRHSVTAASRF